MILTPTGVDHVAKAIETKRTGPIIEWSVHDGRGCFEAISGALYDYDLSYALAYSISYAPDYISPRTYRRYAVTVVPAFGEQAQWSAKIVASIFERFEQDVLFNTRYMKPHFHRATRT